MNILHEYSGIFDSHAHYDDERFDDDRDTLLTGLAAQGVTGVVHIGCNLTSSLAAVSLAERSDSFYAAVGFHPQQAGEYTPEGMAQIKTLFQNPKVVAVGEIGLDYHYDYAPREAQREVFALQCEISIREGLPIVLHTREATQDTLEILQKFPGLRGVAHCYSGSAETAKILVDMGFFIGFTGVLTFANAKKIVEACAAVPLDRILLETDCPYMAPMPYRGKRCESAMIARTAERAAMIHGISAQTLIDHARENSKTLFGIK